MEFGPYLTRPQAIALKSKLYLGKPCKRGHNGLRYAQAGGSCVTCSNQQSKAWADENPDRMRELVYKWRDENPEKSKESKKRAAKNYGPRKNELRNKDRAENPEKNRAADKLYWDAHRDQKLANRKRSHANNPEASKARNMQRYATIRGADGTHTAADRVAIYAAHDGICVYCDAAADNIDHVVSLKNGGTNWPDNLQPLCAHHNKSKNSYNDDQYRKKLGEPAEGKFWQWREKEAA